MVLRNRNVCKHIHWQNVRFFFFWCLERNEFVVLIAGHFDFKQYAEVDVWDKVWLLFKTKSMFPQTSAANQTDPNPIY